LGADLHAAPDAEGEASPGQATERGRQGRGEQRMARVDVGHAGTDPDVAGHGGDRTTDGTDLLDVEALRDPARAEAEGFGFSCLVESVGGRIGVARQEIVAELGEADRHGPHTRLNLISVMSSVTGSKTAWTSIPARISSGAQSSTSLTKCTPSSI